MKYAKKKKQKFNFINNLINSYQEPLESKINKFNEISLTKELKNIIKNNSNNINKINNKRLETKFIKIKPINTHVLKK